MALSDELENEVRMIISTTWDRRDGRKIPQTEEVALAGGAVEIDATFLYADLADSSKIAKELDRRIAAKIIKSFLYCASKLIVAHGGKIVSFDGDRVMGVFYGDFKNSSAAKCALRINWAVKIISEKFEANYESVKNASFKIRHGVGVDTGTVLAVRGGVRGSNDLIWIGRAPNLAAKMSDLREYPYSSFITAAVFNVLIDEVKYSRSEKKPMWERRTWNFLGDKIYVYRSSWSWKP
ncbi:adenylate/guanylate cyclase domain-containing protein [Alcaligenes faecalis]|uniref:adenylate/guanylate cyclase domain-containing protein n=1 Tax=Alcaligenes faecalis TaxID=511 RepID=UPI000E11A97A|nr:adenylate/guanylate cyclase domain-containing protein [Alcaligenes faecalis]SSY68810.1 Adenylate and Guanylate cyclase catalytic domain [Alcaligenes faecalis subsp. faecalis]